MQSSGAVFCRAGSPDVRCLSCLNIFGPRAQFSKVWEIFWPRTQYHSRLGLRCPASVLVVVPMGVWKPFFLSPVVPLLGLVRTHVYIFCKHVWQPSLLRFFFVLSLSHCRLCSAPRSKISAATSWPNVRINLVKASRSALPSHARSGFLICH